MDPNALSALVSAIGQNYSQANDNSKTFSDMLKERRAFVENAGNGVGSQVQGAIDNGSNGTAVSPAALKTPALNFGSGMVNTSTDLTNEMFGYNRQAQDALTALSSLLGTNANTGIERSKLKSSNYLLGLDENGNPVPDGQSGSLPGGAPVTGVNSPTGFQSSGNGVIDLHVKNIMNGTEPSDMSSIPQGLQPRVAQALTSNGYDPARSINGLVGQLKSTFNDVNPDGQSQGTLAYGNDPFQILNSIVSGGLGKVGISTPYEKQRNLYDTLVNSFQSELSKLSGSNARITPTIVSELANGLPKESDPADVAKTKFDNVQKRINDLFYQGGSPPSKPGAKNADPLGLFGGK